MPRLIDADKLKLTDFEILLGGSYKGLLEILLEKIENAPTVDAEPVRHGHWIEGKGGDYIGYPIYECSECGCPVGEEASNYCPYCGAKMDESTIPSDKTYTLYANDKPILTYTESGIVLHGESKEDETD